MGKDENGFARIISKPQNVERWVWFNCNSRFFELVFKLLEEIVFRMLLLKQISKFCLFSHPF
ncbi:MAG: hypothetical protein D6690_01025 [Nitrospirae bacterium]|nr:MAG: hypothetical protein D6690_01025 [Nitrospirota bacterium]